MHRIHNLHTVSSVYFFLIAFTYAFAALAIRNDIYADYMILVIRVMDIPFALVALLYAGTSLYIQISHGHEERESPLLMVIFAVSLLLFGLVVFVNFAFPGQL